MNSNFKIPLNGKVARRLHFLSKIIDIDIDRRIFDHVQDDLVEYSTVNPPFNHTPTVCQLSVVQFADDCDYRCVIGASDELDIMKSLLQCAIISGKKIVILAELGYVPSLNNWLTLLHEMNLPFGRISSVSDIPTDFNQHIIIVGRNDPITDLLRTERSRLLLSVIPSRELPTTITSSENSIIGYSLNDLCREFQYTICGFHLNIQGWPVTTKWAGECGVECIINAINCDTKMSKAVSYDKFTQVSMLDCGYKIRSPEHIGRFLNVNVDLINNVSFKETL